MLVWIKVKVGESSIVIFLPILDAAILIISAEWAKRIVEKNSIPKLGLRATHKEKRHYFNRSRVEIILKWTFVGDREFIWKKVSCINTFLCIDPFHSEVIVSDQNLKQGTRLKIKHNCWGITFYRFGKLLQYKEDSHYAFSDLAGKRAFVKFP